MPLNDTIERSGVIFKELEAGEPIRQREAG